jgi:EAL domain-containing protein (putative c-di-GMP-specific phosphodiesterase class I)
LQALGCRVAIDDFGTGYASYARLKTLNVDLLKIDGSFIRNLHSSSLDYQVVASICHLARMKNMQVVAEYVETPEIDRRCCRWGLIICRAMILATGSTGVSGDGGNG